MLLVLAGCSGTPIVGSWTGQCGIGTGGVRVALDIWSVTVASGDDQTEVLSASVTVHDPEQRDEQLFLECVDVSIDGSEVSVQGCSGSWVAAGEVAVGSFVIEGTVDKASPANMLLGTCTLDGQTGSLDLWRT